MKISSTLTYLLLTPTIESFKKNTTGELSTPFENLNLESCQEKICEQWNECKEKEFYHNTPRAQNWFITHAFRCDSSDRNYKPYLSINRCMKDLCRSAKLFGKNVRQCFINSDEITLLWNRFCPKHLFNNLSIPEKPKFFENCLKKICNYKNDGTNFDYSFLCLPVDLNKSIEKLQQLYKDTLERLNKAEGQAIFERHLSIWSSAVGITSGIIGIVSGGVGLYAAKIAIGSVNRAIPTVSAGLRNIVDGTLAYARRASMAPHSFLTPASAGGFQSELSRISSQVSTTYQNAHSSEISSIYEDAFSSYGVSNIVSGGAGTLAAGGVSAFQETSFNFNEDPAEEVDEEPSNDDEKSNSGNVDEKLKEIYRDYFDKKSNIGNGDEKSEEIYVESVDFDEKSNSSNVDEKSEEIYVESVDFDEKSKENEIDVGDLYNKSKKIHVGSEKSLPKSSSKPSLKGNIKVMSKKSLKAPN